MRAAVWLLGFAPVTYLALSGGGFDIAARSELGIAFWWLVLVGMLAGVLPRALVPVHEVAVDLQRGARLAREPRPPLVAPVRAPAWTFDAGAALWADLEAGAGLVYAGGDDGVLHALDARTGRERWRFATGGRLRARPALVLTSLYLPSDDGWTGTLRTFRTQVTSSPSMDTR